MPGPASDQEKTEPATPKKRQEAFKKGQIAKSQELTTAVSMVSALLLLIAFAPGLVEKLRVKTIQFLETLAVIEVTEENAIEIFRDIMLLTASMVIPLAFGLMVITMSCQIYQAKGIRFFIERLELKPQVLNPITGFKKLLSLRSVVKLGHSLIKVAAIVATIYYTVRGRIHEVEGYGDREALDSMRDIIMLALFVLLRVAIVLLILGIIDYIYQLWQHEKDLRMSFQEIKEEGRSSEGDPKVKGRIRNMQRQAVRERMMADVPDASVVVTNPTHFAVALKYDRDGTEAPLLVAKGRDLIAQRIKAIAKENNVPMVEDKPLAQALYRDVEVGEEIPPRFFRAVAAILAHVLRQDKTLAMA